MKWSVGVIVVPLVLCLFVGIAHGLKCYQCNSNKHAADCSVGFAHEKYLHECNETFANQSATMCRKITQSVDKILNMEDPERTIRSCGYVEPHKNSYYRAGFGSRQLVNTCRGDGCNTAPKIYVSVVLVLSTIGATVVNLL